MRNCWLSRLAPKSPNSLHALLADYNNSLPSSQRLFLMNELHEPFPTHDAESLAAQYLETEGVHLDPPGLRATAIPDVWRVPGPAVRVIALFRTPSLLAAARRQLEGSPVQAVLPPHTAPGQPPDWQVSMPRSGSGSSTRIQTVSYLWVGFLAIAIVTITALIAGQALRRQWRLARLKTDLVAAVSHELKTPISSVPPAGRYPARRRPA